MGSQSASESEYQGFLLG